MLDQLRTYLPFRKTQQQQQPIEKQESNDGEVQREQWDRPIEFILSLIGCSVGLGNVWRYPYIAFKNGGGAFLIPYFCVYFLVGTPVYFLELSLGQFTSSGPSGAFKMSRMLKGIGWSMIINSFFGNIYYNIVLAWCLFYFFASFRRTLQWSDCGNWWNTAQCSKIDQLSNSTAGFFCLNDGQSSNCTKPILPPEEYFNNYVLRRSNSLEEMGNPSWSLALCLLLAWILVAACIIKGIKSSGKVIYFTSLFPYVVILALIIRGVTLPGARNGISFYLKPNWSKIGEFEVWIAAAVQVTFSLGVGYGAILSYASYNKFKTNYFRDCLIVTACDCFTSVFAGFAIFSVLGFMSYKTGLSIDQVAKAGPGLAFIAYPQALSFMPGGPFWAVIFFFMLLTLGLDSQFATSDVVTTALFDVFPKLRPYKSFIIAAYCVICFLLGLPICAPGGIYIFTLLNEYAGSLSVLVCIFLEFIVVTYFYGFNDFMEDIRMMLGKRPFEPYWFFTWCISGPIITLIIIFSSLVAYRVPVEGNYVYPPYATAIGWSLFSIPLVFILGIMIYELIKAWKVTKYSHDEISGRMPHYLRMLAYAVKPDSDWGPAKKEHRLHRYQSENQNISMTIENGNLSATKNDKIDFNKPIINEAFDYHYDSSSRF